MKSLIWMGFLQRNIKKMEMNWHTLKPNLCVTDSTVMWSQKAGSYELTSSVQKCKVCISTKFYNSNHHLQATCRTLLTASMVVSPQPVTQLWQYMQDSHPDSREHAAVLLSLQRSPTSALAAGSFTGRHTLGCKAWLTKDYTIYPDNKYRYLRVEPWNAEEEENHSRKK